MDQPLLVGPFVAFTLGMAVYFIGAGITRRVAFLRDHNIPEPVTGGVLGALALWAVVAVTGRAVDFDLYARDVLLVMFFATIGLNARFADLAEGGRPLAILAVLTVVYIVLQNVVALGGVALLGLPASSAVLFGSAALVGGHGTVVAWGPVIAAEHGVAGALETGIAAATLGLVLASVLGGPVAGFLVERRGAAHPPADDRPVVGLSYAQEAAPDLDYVGLMRTLLTVNLVVIAGFAVHGWLGAQGLRVPLFLPCLIVGVLVANLLPFAAAVVPPVTGTRALALVSEFALAVFLSMSLMTMQLWTLAAAAGPLLAILLAQAAMILLFTVFVVFPALGRDYRAAVLGAGFVGFGLGATPTAIANMTAVTKHYGPSPTAFIVLPLVSAFLTDIANAAAIKLFLTF
jgi:ESS family glutamate:Na+ symporter